jgi:hypothetical protein
VIVCREVSVLRIWQKFLDDQAREFTTIEERGPLLEPCFQW